MNKIVIGMLVVGSSIFGSLAFALDEYDQVASATLSTTNMNAVDDAVEEPSIPIEVGNKICPISKEKIGQHGMEPFQVKYQGKSYNLCCAMCLEDFNKDPEKYIKMLEEMEAEQK